MRTIRTIAVLLLGLATAAAHAKVPAPNWAYAEKRLKKAGLAPSFMRSLKANYDGSDFKSVVELNTLLFLRKTDYHGPQVSDEAVASVKTFIEQNKATFDAVQERYGVTPSVIAGLLWIESRYGENQGKFHVTSALVDLVQADRPSVVKHLETEAAPRFTETLSRKGKREIVLRARKKSKWAIGELKALQTMYHRDAKLVKNLRGSFAGAFGMPQFEPSSYVPYARAAGTGVPDLSKPEDAIHSVANYLHESGWRKNKPTSFEKALLKYNHSHDYARAILRLAWQADGLDPNRIPAGKISTHKKHKPRN